MRYTEFTSVSLFICDVVSALKPFEIFLKFIWEIFMKTFFENSNFQPYWFIIKPGLHNATK
jgi:hypothetical protein